MNKPVFSLYAFAAGAALMLYCCFIFYPKWNAKYGQSTLGWDVSGYYWYLPATFIYHDLKQQKFGDSIIDKYGFTPDFSQSTPLPNGNRVMTYSSGMAIMYLPFFTVAHLLAKPLGYPADGFSTPYAFAITIGSIAVALIGLWYFRKLMLLFHRDKVVAFLLLLLVFGTNYLNYAAIDGSLAHNWLFTIYVFILLNTYHFYKTYKYKYAIRIGLLTGLAILTRPSEIVAGLIPLLWGMESIAPKAIVQRLQFLLSQWKKVAAAAGCVMLVGSIQVIYWLYVSGKPLVYSYGDDKGFSWLHPHFRDYIFSYRSGWLTYTPLVALIFIGVIPFLKYGKNKVAILIFFALNLYIVSAWDIWWYGGTGGRAMIQSYPVILFPFATLLEYILNKRWLTIVVSPVIILLAYFNIWFTYGAHAGGGLFTSEDMNKKFYWHVIYRYHVPREYQKYKDTDELFSGKPKNMRLLFSDGFETDTIRPPLILKGENSRFIDHTKEYTNIASFYYRPQTTWVRAQALFHSFTKEITAWKMPQFNVRFGERNATIKERMIRIHRFLDDNQTAELYIDVKVPREETDSIKIFFWNPGSERDLVIDNLRVWEFNE